MDLPPTRSLADLLPVLRDLEADLVNKLFAAHPTGVRVLFAPEELQRAEAIGGDDVQRVLSGLKPYFDYQVVDTASRITPVTLAALDEADAIVHVVTPEIPALRSAARFLQLTSQLGYPSDKVLLVANRANAGKGITPAVIEEQLQRPLAGVIPSDGRALVACTNGGELIVVTRPRHKVARAVDALAERIALSFGWSPARHNAGGAPSLNGHAGQNGHVPQNGYGAADGPAAPAVPSRRGWWLPLPPRRLPQTPSAVLATTNPAP